jgi:SnoaL-like domain
MDAALEKKLREMVDRHEIWQVLLRYGRGLDRFDVALARSCYFDDAIEDHDAFVGTPDDFIEWANRTARLYVTTHHGLMNHSCELKGDDAYCETYYFFTGVSAAPPHFMSIGRYIDHFQRRGGEWRIANRVTVVEGKFDIPDAVLAHQIVKPYGPEDDQPARRDRGDVSYQRPPRPRPPRQLPAQPPLGGR